MDGTYDIYCLGYKDGYSKAGLSGDKRFLMSHSLCSAQDDVEELIGQALGKGIIGAVAWLCLLRPTALEFGVLRAGDPNPFETANSNHDEEEKTIKQASYIEELKQLKGLLDSGIISQEEFDAKKKQLLGL